MLFIKNGRTPNPFLAGAGIGARFGKYFHWFLKNEAGLILSRKNELFCTKQKDLSFKCWIVREEDSSGGRQGHRTESQG